MSTTRQTGPDESFTETDLRAAVRRSGETESYVQALLADMREHREPEHQPEAQAVPGGLTRSERDLVMADLGQLLEVLGLGDYARPESPHEVMQQCIAKAARLRNGARVLGQVVTGHGRAMEAARIELAQGSADKAMEWILNSLPDLWDDPETAWDGKESAGEWFTRTESFYRATESAPEPSRDPGPPDDTTCARTAAPDGTRERTGAVPPDADLGLAAYDAESAWLDQFAPGGHSTPWDSLDPEHRGVYQRIGEAVAAAERERVAGLVQARADELAREANALSNAGHADGPRKGGVALGVAQAAALIREAGR